MHSKAFARKTRLILFSDEPLYVDHLKFTLYRSAAADSLDKIFMRTQEPWPRGMEMLEKVVNASRDGDKGPRPTVYDLWNAQAKTTEYAKRILESWAATRTSTNTGREMDALLMPCTVWPASEKWVSAWSNSLTSSDECRYGFIYDNYTSLWNVLDYCASTIPVTYVSEVHDKKKDYQGRNETETKIWNGCKCRPTHPIDNELAFQVRGTHISKIHPPPLLGLLSVCNLLGVGGMKSTY